LIVTTRLPLAGGRTINIRKPSHPGNELPEMVAIFIAYVREGACA